MTVPRILPLIGVAVVGVLAINLLGGARNAPQLLSAARAYAEGMTAPDGKPAKSKGGADKGGGEATANSSPLPAGAAAPAPAHAATPVCAPGIGELAKLANLSSGEMLTLERLKDRRSQIEAQGKDLDTQTQLLAAAEAKVDAKLKAMADLKAQIETLLGQTDQKTQAEVDRLTLVYSKMNPKLSAPLMTVLDDKVRIPLAAQLETNKPKLLADILVNMPTLEGKRLTELLARRFAAAQQLADNGVKAQPLVPASPPQPKDTKSAKSFKSAAKADVDAADPDDANVDDKPAAKPRPRPRQVAKRAPAKKPAYRAPHTPKPAEDAKISPGPHPYSEVKDAVPAKPADKPASSATPAKT